jgi:hypothetical protein
MIKTDDLQLMFIQGLEERRPVISLPEISMSLDEWNERRTAAFDVIRKKSEIPDALLSLVEHFKERTPVKLTFQKETGGLKFGVSISEPETKRSFVQGLAEIVAAKEQMDAEDENQELSASEVLAFFLRMYLRDLKYAERRKTAKARSSNLIPRSVIGEIALDLLESSRLDNYKPSGELIGLFRELLNLETTKQGLPRKTSSQERAAHALALDPTLGVRELAKEVGVAPSSVSRWLKNPQFQARVKRAAKTIARRSPADRSAE